MVGWEGQRNCLVEVQEVLHPYVNRELADLIYESCGYIKLQMQIYIGRAAFPFFLAENTDTFYNDCVNRHKYASATQSSGYVTSDPKPDVLDAPYELTILEEGEDKGRKFTITLRNVLMGSKTKKGKFIVYAAVGERSGRIKIYSVETDDRHFEMEQIQTSTPLWLMFKLCERSSFCPLSVKAWLRLIFCPIEVDMALEKGSYNVKTGQIEFEELFDPFVQASAEFDFGSME